MKMARKQMIPSLIPSPRRLRFMILQYTTDTCVCTTMKYQRSQSQGNAAKSDWNTRQSIRSLNPRGLGQKLAHLTAIAFRPILLVVLISQEKAELTFKMARPRRVVHVDSRSDIWWPQGHRPPVAHPFILQELPAHSALQLTPHLSRR